MAAGLEVRVTLPRASRGGYDEAGKTKVSAENIRGRVTFIRNLEIEKGKLSSVS